MQFRLRCITSKFVLLLISVQKLVQNRVAAVCAVGEPRKRLVWAPTNPAVSLLSWRLGANPLVLSRPPQSQSQGKPSFGETPLILAPKNQSE